MERGKNGLLQFFFMNHKILVIGDKKLAKIALKEINGKGFFHNPTPTFVTSGIFSLDTGPEWQQRRSAFRKAFSLSSLRYHTNSVTRLNAKLRGVLDRAAENGEIVKIDDIFTQLTVGVICELAFEMDVKVFESSTNTLNLDEVMNRFFGVCSLHLILNNLFCSMPGCANCHSPSTCTHIRFILSRSIKRLEMLLSTRWEQSTII